MEVGKKKLFYKLMSFVTGFVVTTLVGVMIQYCLKMCEKNGFVNEYEDIIKQYVIEPSELDVCLNDIGGLSSIKTELVNTILLPLKYPKSFFGNKLLRPCRGILLYGPPGTGKTMLAKGLAKEANVPLISVSSCALESKYYGESSKLISSTFDVARKIQPCIVFFDEIDGIGRTRSDFDQSFVSTFKTELLSNLDGIGNKDSDSYIVLACTNTINSLDPALKRRLPNQYKIELPTVEERRHILSILTSDDKISMADLVSISLWTESYSGSDLTNLYKNVSNYRLRESFESSEFLQTLEKNEDVSGQIKSLTLEHWKHVLGIVEKDKNLDVYDVTEDVEDVP